MEQLKNMLKEYANGLTVPYSVTPESVQAEIEKHHISAGMFLKRLRELRVSGADFLELIGNSKIDNIQYLRIEQNPHLKFDDLRQILESSCLTGEDYAAMLDAVSHPKNGGAKQPEQPVITEKSEQSVITEKSEQPVITEKSEQPVITEKAEQPTATEKPEQQAVLVDSEPDTTEDKSEADDEISQEKLLAAQAIIDRVIMGKTDEQDVVSRIVDEHSSAEGSQEAYLSQPEKEKPEDTELVFSGEVTDESDEVQPTAEGIADALNELVENPDENTEPPCKRSRGALIASFVCAGILLLCGIGLKAMYHFGVIPEYVYKLPAIINQKITDFTSLVDEAKDAEGKVSYALPDFLGAEKSGEINPQYNACGENSTVSLTGDNENGWKLNGIEFSAGKIKEEFSFELNLKNPTIAFVNGNYVIAGEGEKGTEVKLYNESALSKKEAITEVCQSGTLEAVFADGEYIYTVTCQSFDLTAAQSTNLRSFVPTFTFNGSETVIPLGNILLPKTVNRLNYITVSAVNASGYNRVKSILLGDAGGYYISREGIYAVDNTVINDIASMRIFTVDFVKDLSSRYIDTNGAADGYTIRGYDGGAVVFGAAYTDIKTDSGDTVTECEPAIYVFDKAKTDISVMTKLPIKEKIKSAECRDNIYIFTESGEKGLSYSIDVTDMTPAEIPAPSEIKTVVNDSIYITAEAETDGDIRKGIQLTVFSDGAKTAEVLVKPDSNNVNQWSKYLTSTVTENGEQIPYYYADGKLITGIPIMYFDGVSAVNEYIFYKYDGAELKSIGKITLYDEQYETVTCRILGGEKPYIVTAWDNRIITADTDKVKIITDKTLKG